jgi:hypothetical protein
VTTDRPWWRDAAPTVVGSWLVARVLTGIAYLIARSDVVTSGRRPPGAKEAFLSYDGSFYWLLSLRGYPRCNTWDFGCLEGRRFFPLFPMLGRALAEISPLAPAGALIVVANVAALAAGFAVWRLMDAIDLGPGSSTAAVWLITLYPASSVLPLAYAESLAIVATATALLAICRRGDRWALTATGAGFLGGLVRPTGIFVTVVVAVEAWRDRRRALSSGEQWPALRWVTVLVAPVAAIASFHTALGVLVDDAAAPLRIQRQLRNGFREPISRLGVAIWRTVTDDFRDGYNVVFALAGIVLVALAATRYRRAIPMSWTLMAAVGFWVALAANNIDSFGRYGLSVFPAWLAALTMLSRERRWVLPLLVGLSAFGYVWMTVTTMRLLVVP